MIASEPANSSCVRTGDVIHMWYYIHDLQSAISRVVYQMDMRGWGIFLIVVIGIGAMCLRGYGSWKEY